MQFITGNNFKLIANYSFDEKGFVVNKKIDSNDIPIYFVKTDFIKTFFDKLKPNTSFKLITHNSDYEINHNFLKYLDDTNLVCWFGQNINIKHPKVVSIPIGIANEIWPHGDVNVLSEIIKLNYKKTQLVYSNFDLSTNFFERQKCFLSMKKNGITMSQKKDFRNYLTDLSQSYFSISPNGNGIDCHKLWESLYLKTIPIVTKSINIDFYTEFPILVIDSWETFDSSILSEQKYFEFIRKLEESKLDFKYFKDKIKLW